MRDEFAFIPRRGVGIGVEPAERQVRTGKERYGEGARRSSGKRAGAAGDRCRPVGGDEAVEIPAAGLEPVDGDFGGVIAIALCGDRSEEHTSELQSLMRISYAVFCLKKKNT